MCLFFTQTLGHIDFQLSTSSGSPLKVVSRFKGLEKTKLRSPGGQIMYQTKFLFLLPTGILDMFGFEDSKPSQLEQLCINLSSETMQHFYNTHIFKSSIESCREEGIASDVIIDYIDNVPCIDLISSLVSF